MKKIIHPLAGAFALILIMTFWASTVLVELTGSEAQIIWLKTTLPWAFLALIPAMMTTGGSGFSLTGPVKSARLKRKTKRMKLAAANGIVILIPAALLLAWKASRLELDAVFYAVQVIELMAGALNIYLLSRNFADGRAMTSIRRRVKAQAV